MSPSLQIDLLAPEEAANLLRRTIEAVRRGLRTGRLPGREADRRQWRPWRADLDACLQPARTDSGGSLGGR